MRRSERGLILTRPGSTAREKRPNLVTRPTLPCETGLYGLGQMKQQGMAPQKPTKLPRLLTSHCCQCTIDGLIVVSLFGEDILIDPYQPCWAASSLSPCKVCAYDGCKSSRLGGCTLMTPAF